MTSDSQQPIKIAALYKFATFPDFETLQPEIHARLKALDIKGTLLLAAEGMNGTIAGQETDIDEALAFLSSIKGFDGLESKTSFASHKPFLRLKVRLKKEIVTIGDPAVDPNLEVGTYVKPQDWNALISDPDVILIDTRNDYEVGIGTFENAIDPNTTSFRSFPSYVAENLDPAKHKKVAMFCTGGIRCEKASSFMKMQGFDEVFHLKGGILNYFEEVPAEDSMWQGECFVFDDRVSVNHKLEPGNYKQCFGCRRPLSPEDLTSEQYEKGVSCPHCFDTKSAKDRMAYRERQRQIELAKARGKVHLGNS